MATRIPVGSVLGAAAHPPRDAGKRVSRVPLARTVLAEVVLHFCSRWNIQHPCADHILLDGAGNQWGLQMESAKLAQG